MRSLDGIVRDPVRATRAQPVISQPTPVVVGPVFTAPTIKDSARDIALRSLKTFAQGAAAAWLLTGNQLTKSALIGALAAGISAAMNLAIAGYRVSKG